MSTAKPEEIEMKVRGNLLIVKVTPGKRLTSLKNVFEQIYQRILEDSCFVLVYLGTLLLSHILLQPHAGYLRYLVGIYSAVPVAHAARMLYLRCGFLSGFKAYLGDGRLWLTLMFLILYASFWNSIFSFAQDYVSCATALAAFYILGRVQRLLCFSKGLNSYKHILIACGALLAIISVLFIDKEMKHGSKFTQGGIIVSAMAMGIAYLVFGEIQANATEQRLNLVSSVTSILLACVSGLGLTQLKMAAKL